MAIVILAYSITMHPYASAHVYSEHSLDMSARRVLLTRMKISRRSISSMHVDASAMIHDKYLCPTLPQHKLIVDRRRNSQVLMHPLLQSLGMGFVYQMGGSTTSYFECPQVPETGVVTRTMTNYGAQQLE